MISNLTSNSTFSSNLVNNKASTHTINKNANDEKKSVEITKNSLSRADEIKNAIQNGSYQVDVKTTAEKMAQNLLG